MTEENLRLREHDAGGAGILFQGYHVILNICSRLAGASCGALPTARITTLKPSSGGIRGKNPWNTLIRETNERYICRTVVEPSLGADRVVLAFLCDAYDEEVVDSMKSDTRVVLHLHPALAPVQGVQSLPLVETSWPLRREEIYAAAG